MPKSIPTPHATHLEVKNQLLDALHSVDADSGDFAKLLVQYKIFCEIEALNKPQPTGIVPWIPAIGNVTGVVTMGVFEAFGTIFTSKAVSLFGGKLK